MGGGGGGHDPFVIYFSFFGGGGGNPFQAEEGDKTSTLEDVYLGTTEKLSLSRKTLFSKCNRYIKAETLMNNYANVFECLARLRQVVDHPYLLEYPSSSENKNEHECGLCHDPATEDCVREEIKFMVESDGSAKAIVPASSHQS
ncbi:unnamed protein product [Cochlearia groenlandica]